MRLKNEIARFNYPILMIHGAKDVISNPQDSVKFLERIASRDKNYKPFEEGFHQLHDDNELYNLQKCIYEWCKTRSNKSQGFCKTFIVFLVFYWIFLDGTKNQMILYGTPKKSMLRKMPILAVFFFICWVLKYFPKFITFS